jgi:mannosyltransferase
MLLPERTVSVSVGRYRPLAWTSRISAEGWALAALTIVAALLRFATLTSQSFWVDEATTAHEMTLSFGALLHQVRVNETTPPLYFVIAWVWTKLFGSGEVGLRSLSVFLGIAVIPVTYLCGKELVSRAAGLVAAAFAAFSPFMIWYSQEARSYMLFGLLSGASLLLCARAWRDPSPRNLFLWAGCSALALLTHFFAGFLIVPEAVLLLTRSRARASISAVLAVAIVQLALLPLAISDTSHPLGWIKQFPLAVRVKQVPVDLSLGSLYQSSLVNGGLIGAGALLAVVIALLWLGGGPAERRGAAFAGTIAAAVLFVPLLLAWVGHDYLVPRNFMPAWIPLAVVLAAACTVPRARVAGGALAVVVLGAFIYAEARIERQPQYQRPNWRGVAAALGNAAGTRAVIAYDGTFATQPLSIYLPQTPWAPPPRQAPVSITEVDVVGSSWQAVPRQLPRGIRLVGSRAVDGLLVERFAVRPSWRLSPSSIAARATSLLVPAPAAPGVLIQPPSAQ